MAGDFFRTIILTLDISTQKEFDSTTMQFVVYPYTYTLQHSSGVRHAYSQIFFSVLHALIDAILYLSCLSVTAGNLSIQSMFFLTGTMTICMMFMQMYSFRNIIILEETASILKVETLIFAISCVYLYSGSYDGSVYFRVFLAVLLFTLLTLAARHFLRVVMFRFGLLVKSVLILGAGTTGENFAQNIASPFRMRKVIGFLDDDPQKQGTQISGFPVLGKTEDLSRIQGELHADEIVIADEALPRDFANNLHADVYILNRPNNEISQELKSPVGLALKALVDYVGAIVALVVFSPIMLWAAYRIKKEDGGKIFFYHTRIGKDLVPFGVCKFRTMRPDAAKVLEEMLKTDENLRAEFARDFKLKDDPRVTKIGHILRDTSIDELPQLFNVLKGEMSLVGPRPIVHKEVRDYYGYAVSRQVFAAKPGMTGIWQVSGRSDVKEYDTRISYDMNYINHWSVWLDIAILFKTPTAVLSKEGAY